MVSTDHLFLGDEAVEVERFLFPGCLVLDIGAHHGAFTSFALAHGAEVLAFEPEPSNFAQLKESLTGEDGVWSHAEGGIFPYAIGRYNGYADIEVPFEQTSGSYLVPGDHVRVMGWDTLMKGCPRRVDLMKMDIEGGEYDLFPDADLPGINHFVIETHDWQPLNGTREGIGHRSSGPARRPGAYEELVDWLARTHQLTIRGGSAGGYIIGSLA